MSVDHPHGWCDVCQSWQRTTARKRLGKHTRFVPAKTRNGRHEHRPCGGGGGRPSESAGIIIPQAQLETMAAHGQDVAIAGEACDRECEAGEWTAASRSVFRWVLTQALKALDDAERGREVKPP